MGGQRSHRVPEIRKWRHTRELVWYGFDKAAPNKENAIKLMEWLTGDEAQAIYAEQNGEYPLKPGAETSELVKSWGELSADDKALIEIAKLRPASLKLTEQVAFDE